MIVGNTLLWAGAFWDEEQEVEVEYLLFDDGSVIKMPGEGSGEVAMVLESGLDVLQELVKDTEESALSVLKLKDLLASDFASVGNATKKYRAHLRANGAEAAPAGQLQTGNALPDGIFEEQLDLTAENAATTPEAELADDAAGAGAAMTVGIVGKLDEPTT